MYPVKILRQLWRGIQGHLAYVSGKNNKDNLKVGTQLCYDWFKEMLCNDYKLHFADVLDGEKADVQQILKK